MDDFDLHSDVLTDLASLPVEDSPTGQAHDLSTVADLLWEGVDLPSSSNTSVLRLSSSQANYIIAFGQHIKHSRHVSAEQVQRLVQILDKLPAASIQTYAGLRRLDDWPVADEVTKSTIASLLTLTQKDATLSGLIFERLAIFEQSLLDLVSKADHPVLIFHILPCLNGLRRALAETDFICSPTDAARLPQASTKLRQHLTALANARVNQTSRDGNYGYHLIARYDLQEITLELLTLRARNAAFSAALRPTSGVSLLEHSGWHALTLQVANTQGDARGLSDDVGKAARTLEETVRSEQEDAIGGREVDSDLLVEQIRAATLATVAHQKVNQSILDVLFQLTSETSPVVDLPVQSAALDSMRIHVVNFPQLAESVVKHLRKLVTSPFEADIVETAPEYLIKSSQTLAYSLKNWENRDGRLSTIYSLLNYLPAAKDSQSAKSTPAAYQSTRSDSQSFRTNGGGRSEDQRLQISINALFAVTQVALEIEDEEVTRLCVSMFLQRLRGTNPIVEAAVLENLASLSPLLSDADYAQVVRAFSDVSRSTALSAEDPRVVKSAVLTAQTRLAQSIDNRPERAELYLRELLELFVSRGLQLQQQPEHRPTLIAHMFALLPVIEAVVNVRDYTPHLNPDEDTVTMFRNTWFLIVLLGFLTSNDTTNWQRNSLKRIAAKTPCLVRGAAADYIQNDLEYNSILRKDLAATHGSQDHVRSELGAALPQHASTVRSLTHAQSALMLVILRVEVLRAQAGRPAQTMAYFQHEGLASGPLAQCMTAISEQVSTAYRSYLNVRVSEHSLEPMVFAEVNTLAEYCCQPSAHARQAAINFLNSIVHSFRSLICSRTCVTTMLELLTLVRRACEVQYDSEYEPVYDFTSELSGKTISLPDEYATRDAILADVYKNFRNWLGIALTRAPYEMQSLLQDYIKRADMGSHFGQSEMGKSVALDLARMTPGSSKEASLPFWGGWKSDSSMTFANSFATRQHYRNISESEMRTSRSNLSNLARNARTGKAVHMTGPALRDLLYAVGSGIIREKTVDAEAIHHVVFLPVQMLTADAVSVGVEVWSWIIAQRPTAEHKVMAEIVTAMSWTLHKRKGVFSTSMNAQSALLNEIEYSATDKKQMQAEYKAARKLLAPHMILLEFLQSRFQSFRYSDKTLVNVSRRMVLAACAAVRHWSTHPLAREIRIRFLTFAFCILQCSRVEAVVEYQLRESIYKAAFAWFACRPAWSFGSNRLQIEADVRALRELQDVVATDTPSNDFWATSSSSDTAGAIFPGGLNVEGVLGRQRERKQLLSLLLESEVNRLDVWSNPLGDNRSKDHPTPALKALTDEKWGKMAHIAWGIDPMLALRMTERFIGNEKLDSEVSKLIRKYPEKVRDTPEAVPFVVDGRLDASSAALRQLMFWAPVQPVIALKMMLPKYGGSGLLIQYAMQTLEHHDMKVIFFYIPQIVQALRDDELGYMERFIFETSKVSQLFCHQIIWNMKANLYKDDEAEEEDPKKPEFDRMIDMVVSSLSGEAKEFYEREFNFFDEVTSISKKLQPYIKKSKPEKKAKIDEEMGKIKVDQGVYLPSNPDGVVVDIDRHSGIPLQSHAKAPFMAKFKVRKEKKKPEEGEQMGEAEDDDLPQERGDKGHFEIWQAAIFKVGDDCRQDLLALQMIGQFKNMFTACGLDAVLIPYRVTATGPGMGVIDVVPNATSRDEMGRGQINDLLGFFKKTYGDVDKQPFQKARTNFIQSMAAYSVICYIIQIKDRHNGNIMIDGNGCITHIDFGFLFDIGPGGVKFEPNSFKLTHEMVDVMGGVDSQGFRLFNELTVKAFLACRPYSAEICETARLMMGTDLPSFKGEATIDRILDRFKPQMNERQAAEWMKSIIANAQFSARSIVYDRFQLAQNGIPFKR